MLFKKEYLNNQVKLENGECAGIHYDREGEHDDRLCVRSGCDVKF